MSASLNGLIPQFRPWAQQLIYTADRNGWQPRVTSTRRSRSAQSRLYRNYLQGHSQFPAAPPGTSAHEFGFAMDMIVYPMSALPSLGKLWRSWGGVWGANDPIHFEYPGFPHRTPEMESDPFLTRAARVASYFAPAVFTTEPGEAPVTTYFRRLFQ